MGIPVERLLSSGFKSFPINGITAVCQVDKNSQREYRIFAKNVLPISWVRIVVLFA